MRCLHGEESDSAYKTRALMASFLLFGSHGICLTPSFRIDKSHNRVLLINTLICLQDASMISSPAPTNRLVAVTGRQQIVRGIVKNACIVKVLIHKFIVDPKKLFVYIQFHPLNDAIQHVYFVLLIPSIGCRFWFCLLFLVLVQVVHGVIQNSCNVSHHLQSLSALVVAA